MSERFRIEPMGDHDYLAHARHSAGVIRFRASPAVVGELDAAEADEQRVIEETALYLGERQPVSGLPAMVDLVMSPPPTVTTTSTKGPAPEGIVRRRPSPGSRGVRRSGHRHPARLRIPAAGRR